MKQLRSTLILLVLALFVGGYIYFNERGPTLPEGSTILLRTDPDAIRTVQLSAPSQPSLRLSRVDKGWQVARLRDRKTDLQVRADDATVKALLGQFKSVQTDEAVFRGETKTYGLDTPRKTLTLDGQRIEFGNSPSFDPAHVYARVGTKIALVSSTLEQALLPSLDAWRDKSVLHFESDAVKTIQPHYPAIQAHFQKQGSAWHITKPLAVDADSNLVRSMLASLANERISKWLNDTGKNSARWGLDKPLATLQVGSATLAIGRLQSGGYAARNNSSPSVFLLPTSLFEAWNRPVAFWRDKTIVRAKPGEMTRMVMTMRGKTKTMVKNGDRWSVQGEVTNQQTHSLISDIAYWASGVQAIGFVDTPANRQKYGLDKPEMTLVITSNQTTTLQIGRVGESLYASNGGRTVYELSPDALENLKPSLEPFFPRPKGKTSSGIKN